MHEIPMSYGQIGKSNRSICIRCPYRMCSIRLHRKDYPQYMHEVLMPYVHVVRVAAIDC